MSGKGWASPQLQWDYDRFGNRRNQTLTGGDASVTQPQLNISETTNRITDPGFAYDAAGNMTNDAIHTFAYDAENRIKTVDGTAATYTYDAGPLRIKKVVGATTTVYIFSGSKVIAEYANGALSKECVYAGSTLLATVTAGGTRTYHHADHLSIRSDTNATGDQVRSYGHFPFGETWYEEAPQGQTLVPSKWKFTSYERESESQLDYAIFRGYNSRLGRFMQADPLAGFIENPQSMNRYSYVANDPVNLVDPLGLWMACYNHYQDYMRPDGTTYTVLEYSWCTSGPDPQGGGGGGGPSVATRKKKPYIDLRVLAACIQQLFPGVQLAAFSGATPGGSGYFIGIGPDLRSRRGASGPIVVAFDASTYTYAQISQIAGTEGFGFTSRRFPYQGYGNNNNNAVGTLITQAHELAHSLFYITQTITRMVPEPREMGFALEDCLKQNGGIKK